MIAEFGESALWSTLIISFIRLGLPSILRHQPPLLCWRGQQVTALYELGCMTFAMGGLIVAYIISDFSLQNVASNSHSAHSLLYKIAGAWSNHEGSMLLWLYILSLYGGVLAWHKPFEDATQQRGLNRILTIHALLMLLLVSYVLKTSNPFVQVADSVLEGAELNPLLQDPALAIHPPILYLGYVGFAVPFCYAVGGWIESPDNSLWIKSIRRWVLWSWSFLTLGIALGSLWAYYELGWGGWWFWDPVENASLLPWLTATALVHTLFVTQNAQHLSRTTWALTVATFILCLLGTFLVRSGVLTTIHAFAYDPERGFYLLMIIGIICIFTILIACKGYRLKPQRSISVGVYLPAAIGIMTYLLVVMMLTVLIGTLYPLLMEAIGGPQLSVGAPYFAKTFIPIGFILLILLAVAGYLPWQPIPFAKIVKRIHWGFSALFAGLFCIFFLEIENFLAAIGLVLGIWVVGMTLMKPILQKPFRLQHLMSGMVLAHLGCGIMVIGMTADHLGRQERVVALKIDETITFAGHQVCLKEINRYREPTYMAERAKLEIKWDSYTSTIFPEKRFYPTYEALITKTALMPEGLSVFYTALGGILPDERWTIRLYYHPYILLIWIGAAMMMSGGLKAWYKRRQGKNVQQ